MFKNCQRHCSYCWTVVNNSKFCVHYHWSTPLPNQLYSQLQPVYDLLSWSWHCPLSNVTKDLPVLFMSNQTQPSFPGRCWALCQNNGPDRNHLPVLLHLDSRWWKKRAWKLQIWLWCCPLYIPWGGLRMSHWLSWLHLVILREKMFLSLGIELLQHSTSSDPNALRRYLCSGHKKCDLQTSTATVAATSKLNNKNLSHLYHGTLNCVCIFIYSCF